MTNWFKRNGIHFGLIAIFFAISFFYFTPAFQDKTLGQSDVVGAQSTQTEINTYKAKGATILWTNQIFGGMPAFQLWASYPNNITTQIIYVFKTIFPNPIDTILILMVGAYFLFIVLKLNPWLAAAGALAFTFSSYNIILLVAGHSNQEFAIAFFAPIIASILLTLRGKHLTGAALTALFLAMEIRANHIQMTYYLMFALFILIGVELYHAIKTKTTPSFLKSLAYLSAAVIVALGVNASILWSTYDYGKDTIRGQSNLTQQTNQPSNGLDKGYAYQYSQGIAESFTFLVPNAAGGGSGDEKLDPNSETVKLFTNKGASEEQAMNAVQQINSFPGLSMYWGDKRPSTFGPYYFGAVICFLFVLGLIIVKNRLKWWLLATIILTMLLSFGGNFPFVSDLFFNYFPLYNKFRAVESILAVAGLCFPILAVLAIQEIISNPDKASLFKKLLLAFYITGGLTLVLIVFPEIFLSFKPHDQLSGVASLTKAMKGDASTANSFADAIVKDRTALEKDDAIRSLIFITIGFGLLWAFLKQKLNVTVMSIAFLALILVDLWGVDKRYLKEANFQDKQDASQLIKPRPADLEIMKDQDPDFRVFDYTNYQYIKQDTFNPFFHKSISGYSAARLKRYNELIDNQLAQNIPNQHVLDMLNTKYIITADSSQNAKVIANTAACGNAWFVKSVKFVANADQEMQALTNFDPKNIAIVDQQYRSLISKTSGKVDSTETIKLTDYNPDDMIYQSVSATPQIAVFSEIYYNRGWKMLIDGKEQPYFRADYLLRATQIPAGKHTVAFIFHPASYYTGERISLVASIILLIGLGGAGYSEIRKKS